MRPSLQFPSFAAGHQLFRQKYSNKLDAKLYVRTLRVLRDFINTAYAENKDHQMKFILTELAVAFAMLSTNAGTIHPIFLIRGFVNLYSDRRKFGL